MKTPNEEALSFLEKVDPEIREKYSNYKQKVKERLTGESQMMIRRYNENPFFDLLLRYERWFSQFNQGVPKSTSIGDLKLMQFGFDKHVLEETEIVDVNGKKISKSLSEFYGQQIIDAPESFWDVFFEMEVGSLLIRSNLEVYPIDESANESNSADILYKDNSTDIYIECKNKRQSTAHEWELEKFATDITEKLWTTYNLGEVIKNDSFAVELSCEKDISKELLEDRDYRENIIIELSKNLYELITKKEKSKEVKFDDLDFKIELISYYEGIYKKELTQEEYNLFQQKKDPSAIMNPFEHLEVNPNSLRDNGHGDFKCRLIDNQLEVFQSYVFNLSIPWDIDYHKWIIKTIRAALEQHKNENKIIIFVKIPPGIVYKMRTDKILNHREKEVTKWERLRELIIGIFDDNNRRDRLMAVVLSTDMLIPDNGAKLQPAHCMYINNNVIDQIPEGFENFIEKYNEIGEKFDFLAYFLMGKISR